MPTYTYKAREETGKLVTGKMDAVSEAELADKLQKMGYIPTNIVEALVTIQLEGIGQRFRKIKTSEMIMFNMQLANMIESGLTLLSSLDTISRQMTNKKFKEVIRKVHRSIAGGSSFSDALKEESQTFPALFISMVRAGETGGTLSTTLNRYAVYIEQQEDLNQKIKNALFYPLILFFVGITVIIFIVSFVMPKFITIFTKANVVLPLPTLIIYQVGVGLKKYWYLMILAVYLSALLVRMYARTESGRWRFDQWKLQLPVIGPLVRQVTLSRLCRTLANLLQSGVPLLQALDVTGDVVGNEIFKRELKKACRSVEKGERLVQTFSQSDEFPPDVVQMVSVGEETGKIDKMLYKIADFYDIVISYSIKKLITLIEPAFIIVMGAMVGFIMASMILPLFDMVKTIQR